MSEKMNDKINETILREAFKEAAEQEIAELEAMDIEVPSPTEKQRKEIEKAIQNSARRPKWNVHRFWKCAAMIAITFCVAASVILFQPKVRASVWDFVVSFYEKYLSFDFDKKEPSVEYEFGDHVITYMTEGFILTDTQANPLKTILNFTNGEESIRITSYKTELTSLSLDFGQAVKKDLTINGCSGYIVSQKDSGMKWLAWGDDSKAFLIKSTISEKELKKIAENIE